MTSMPPWAEWTAGRKARLELKSGRRVEGRVFCYDDVSFPLIALECERPNQDFKDVVIVNADAIKSAKLSSNADAETSYTLPRVSVPVIQARMERLSQKEERRRFLGVSMRGFEVFEALDKTFSCDWVDGRIVENELGVSISSPYFAENVSGSDSSAVDHIRSIVSAIR